MELEGPYPCWDERSVGRSVHTGLAEEYDLRIHWMKMGYDGNYLLAGFDKLEEM